jgi:PAS domain S-box-containing protein
VRANGIIQDVTLRKQAEETLQRNELRLASAIDIAQVGFYEENGPPERRFTSSDQRARSIAGIPPDCPDDHMREFWFAHVHPDDAQRVVDWARGFDEAGGVDDATLEYRYNHLTRGPVWLRHMVHAFARDADGRVVRLMGVMQDVTERKQTEESLRQNELRLASAIDIADLGFYEQSHEERTTFIDCRAQAIVGFHGEQDEENAVFQFWAKHLCPEDSPRILNFHRELDEGTMDRVTADYRYQHPQRGVIWIHHLVHVVDRRAGKRVRTIGVLQDITEHKQAELALARGRAEVTHLSRVAMLGELSGALAHELNQPLTAILSNAQAAQRFLADDQPDLNDLRDILNDIVHDDQRAGEVIRRLRSLLKKGEVSHQPLNLNEIVGDVLRLAHNDLLIRNIATRTNFAHGVVVAKGDRVQLQQVLLNLIMNAADAMATCAPPDRQLFVGTETAGPSGVRVSVIDSGPGIAPDVLSRLFDPFVTTKAHGLGLGLKVCRTIIESHGGQITGVNNPGRGATFAFTLPVEAMREEEGTEYGE